MSAQESLFQDYPKVSSARRSDPRTAKQAAASAPLAKAEQWKVLLQRLHDGPISADTAAVVIGKHRSIASSRLGVMAHRGLVEPAGEHKEQPADGGRARNVLRYRLTEAGRLEYSRMFGGWQ